jgi:predicted small metal-binding protein
MTFKLACGDVMPGCSARFESTDRDELMGEVASHTASAHGITNLTPDLRALIQSRTTFAS